MFGDTSGGNEQTAQNKHVSKTRWRGHLFSQVNVPPQYVTILDCGSVGASAEVSAILYGYLVVVLGKRVVGVE